MLGSVIDSKERTNAMTQADKFAEVIFAIHQARDSEALRDDDLVAVARMMWARKVSGVKRDAFGSETIEFTFGDKSSVSFATYEQVLSGEM